MLLFEIVHAHEDVLALLPHLEVAQDGVVLQDVLDLVLALLDGLTRLARVDSCSRLVLFRPEERDLLDVLLDFERVLEVLLEFGHESHLVDVPLHNVPGGCPCDRTLLHLELLLEAGSRLDLLETGNRLELDSRVDRLLLDLAKVPVILLEQLLKRLPRPESQQMLQ